MDRTTAPMVKGKRESWEGRSTAWGHQRVFTRNGLASKQTRVRILTPPPPGL